MDAKQLAALLHRAEQQLNDKDYQTIERLAESYAYLTELVADKDTTIESLRNLLKPRSEKTSTVLGDNDAASTESNAEPDGDSNESSGDEDGEPPSRPGHGRNGVNDFPGANRVAVGHRTLQSGDECPHCGEGTVYAMAPGVLLRFTGQAPFQATVYELQKLRCGLCGNVFTAEAPAEAGQRKYDAQTASMVGLLKYGTGMPFNRVAGLQRGVGIPLPPSTQWEIARDLASVCTPAYDALIREAAQSEVMYIDDTSVRILELMDPASRERLLADQADLAKRTGLFTSGVIAAREKRHIALFFSGPKHAGENLRELLRQRQEELPIPIQMCDGLSRNLQDEFETIVGNCLTHGRRKFVVCHACFPSQSRDVILSLKSVYRNDALTKGMSDSERLAFHQQKSGPVMAELHERLSRQLNEKLVEPNSRLGGAIKYMLKHWQQLTLFLREPGAPLDNNICERALKRIIIHRKNSLFFKTQKGARVGDCLMSLIYTCELNGVSAFDYLTALQDHADRVAAAPQEWMPWNYLVTSTTQAA